MKNLLSAIVAITIVGPLAWITFNREPPYKIIGGETLPATIVRGEQYRLVWEIKPSGKICLGTVYRRLIDVNKTIWVVAAFEDSFATEIAVTDLTHRKIVGAERLIPKEVALGPAEILVSVQHFCNLTQYIWPLWSHFPVAKTMVSVK